MTADETRRCTDPKQGVKVLSYDLLEADERAQVDAHLEACRSCRDLRDQVFGDEGAFRELEYRAFKLSQRQKVPATAWFAQRLRDLWIPFAALVVLVSLFGLWMIRRPAQEPPVQLLRFQALRAATLDTTSTMLVPRLEPGIESIVLQTDRDASLLLYETNDKVLRRLLPPAGAEAPELQAHRTLEFAVPKLQDPDSRMLLVLVPAPSVVEPDVWDQAMLQHFGDRKQIDFEKVDRHWPGRIIPTIRLM